MTTPEIRHASSLAVKPALSMKTKPQWIDQADAALQRAAKRAHELAATTGTPLHVMREGKLVKLMPSKATKR